MAKSLLTEGIAEGNAPQTARPDAGYPDDAYAEEVIEGVNNETPEADMDAAPAPIEDVVRQRAYDLWVEAGQPPGGSDLFWEQAEEDVNDARDASGADGSDAGTDTAQP